MVKTIVTGNTKEDHSDRPTVVLSDIERNVRIHMEFGLRIDGGYNLLTRPNSVADEDYFCLRKITWSP